MEDEKPVRRRKSLAVDEETYDKLNKICSARRRSKIQQLQVLIENEYNQIFHIMEEDQ
jgi:hypothetical protein